MWMVLLKQRLSQKERGWGVGTGLAAGNCWGGRGMKESID